LYGRLLKELGFLSNGDVVTKSASDFVGQYIGQSQKQTNQILEQARGKVLIIDEAYALNDSWYGKQVLDTLVEKVQGTSSDDIAVLLLGYENEMLKMLREQNPGLSRRFPMEHAFFFDDYADNELLAILELNLKSHDVEATLSFREKALAVLKVQKKQSNFGNAGSVELLVKGAALKASKRVNGTTTTMLELEESDIDDPGAARAEKDEDPLLQLDKLYRMEKVKEKLIRMKNNWEVQRREGEEEPELGHFVFLGSPGKLSLPLPPPKTEQITHKLRLTRHLHFLRRNWQNYCSQDNRIYRLLAGSFGLQQNSRDFSARPYWRI
jgi:hypothetical protein